MHKALLRKFALPDEKFASKIHSLKVHGQVYYNSSFMKKGLNKK